MCTNSFAIRDLVKNLKSYQSILSTSILDQELRKAAIQFEDIQEFLQFKEESYNRIPLERNSNFDLLLLCWRSGQSTPIHNHAKSACGVVVVSGIATEISYSRSECGYLVPEAVTRNTVGDAMTSFDQEIHQMGNFEKLGTDLCTLHCYSPPLRDMQIFSRGSTIFNHYDEIHDRVRSEISALHAS